MKAYRVVIINDHILMRQGFIGALGKEWQVAGEGGTVAEAQAVFSGLAEKPHLVALDNAQWKPISTVSTQSWGLTAAKP